MEWTATFIAPAAEIDGAPTFRGQFVLSRGADEIQSAVLRYSAKGVIEVTLNGRAVSDEVLAPGWTSYEWRLRYSEVDVTSLIGEPEVEILATVADGWYRGRLAWRGGREVYGDRAEAIIQLTVLYRDGTEEVVGTDSTWSVAGSAITRADLYDGETIDARLRSAPAQWSAVTESAEGLDRLVPAQSPAVTRTGTLAPVRTWESSGALMVDFGQNLVGWLKLVVQGPSGRVIRVRHAEVLEGEALAIRPLRSALATDEFILSGGLDEFEPTFTLHGFRYIAIEGCSPEVALSEITAVVVGSTLTRRGWFESSSAELNRLHENVVWSTRGNFVSIPTDCPQRDERLGWTGDIAVFASTAAFLVDSSAFLADWLGDVRTEQAAQHGVVPWVVPDVLKYPAVRGDLELTGPTAIWSDAIVWVPWALWMTHGDPRVIHDNLDAMVAHLRAVESQLSERGVWEGGFQFGDWLDPDAPDDKPGLAKADPDVVATAVLYRSSALVSRMAAAVEDAAATRYAADLADRTLAAFHDAYVTRDPFRILSDCATVYALAIAFDMLDGDAREAAGDRLAELVAEAGYRISTGFAGTPFILDALTSTGHGETATRLLFQRERPSWLYPVTMGATTVWERWDSLLPDGSVNPGQMTSFNHYALGAVAAWLHETLAGVSPAEPGYSRIRFAPLFAEQLDHAGARIVTARGEAGIRWERRDGSIVIDLEVPAGATGVLCVAGDDDRELTAGRHRVTVAAR
ncbi:alpha-L-rhamnosidase [Antiquaquibacter soli]|uniref:alpha-L-rhamnosidase n=1 Tax=Antiquaquibacter soli TaxID=3064523 RepID=A0ABT9BTF3_9MICO|nr:alpha-L-rhamnosidase [Protaetiibacter sp. WY-16]MDO7882627.1 family 78 glycoside hydrolase catalytic domain [Protaetiibacter sp. WY-16]